jgi:Protein of unknown function (DUF4238)
MSAADVENAFRSSPLFQELERINNEEDPSYFESQAKRQHFVPQLMLREFSTEVAGKHYLYQLDVRSGAPRRVQVEAAASRRYFYAVTNEDGSRNNRVEGFLSIVESQAGPALRGFLDDPAGLAPGDRATLSFFFAVLDPRTPGGHERSEAVSDASMRMLMATDFAADSEAFVNRYRGIFEGKDDAEIEAFRERTLRMLETGELGFADPRARALQLSIRASADVAQVVYQMSWTLLKAERGFITSDRGLAMRDPSLHLPWESEAWASSPNVEVTIPLTEDACLALHYDSPAAVVEIEQSDVEELNLRTYGWARDYIFGESQEDVASVRAFAKRRPHGVPRPRSRHQVLLFEADPLDTTIAEANVRRGWPRYLKTDGIAHDYFVIGPKDNAATISARVSRIVQERAARAAGLPPGTRPPGRADVVPVNPFDVT